MRQGADNPGSVLALTIPAAFFAATDTNNNNGTQIATGPSDTLRDDFLRISRGFAVILLVMCATSLSFFNEAVLMLTIGLQLCRFAFLPARSSGREQRVHAPS